MLNKQLFEVQIKGLVGMAQSLAAKLGIVGLKERAIAPGESLSSSLDQIRSIGTGDCHLTKLTAEIGGRPAVLILCVGAKPTEQMSLESTSGHTRHGAVVAGKVVSARPATRCGTSIRSCRIRCGWAWSEAVTACGSSFVRV